MQAAEQGRSLRRDGDVQKALRRRLTAERGSARVLAAAAVSSAPPPAPPAGAISVAFTVSGNRSVASLVESQLSSAASATAQRLLVSSLQSAGLASISALSLSVAPLALPPAPPPPPILAPPPALPEGALAQLEQLLGKSWLAILVGGGIGVLVLVCVILCLCWCVPAATLGVPAPARCSARWAAPVAAFHVSLSLWYVGVAVSARTGAGRARAPRRLWRQTRGLFLGLGSAWWSTAVRLCRQGRHRGGLQRLGRPT